MAKQIKFNGKEISAATFQDTTYLRHVDVSAALGYKGSAPTPDEEPIIVGINQYYSVHSYREGLKATGDRRKNLDALLARYPTTINATTGDDIGSQWLHARDDVRTARKILAEAVERESRLFNDVSMERENNG